MESLKIKEFLIIKNSQFDIGRVNIIIGVQANGKSLLVKLLYLFREVINDIFVISIQNREIKKEFIKRIISSFVKYFPKYTWVGKNIDIIYVYNDIEIKIYKSPTQKMVKVEFSKFFTTQFSFLKREYGKFLRKDDFISNNFGLFKEECLKSSEFYPYFNNSIFIPASRTFFANLQKNIFSFLAESIDIDPFMKEFGSKYEIAKRTHSDTKFKPNEKFNNILEKILKGKYRYFEKQDWIESKEGIINLANASSGQQESLPMLLILSVFSFINPNEKKTYFIEEPEAHLFPISQKHIVELIGLVYNGLQDIVITTHSPYILTALNNLLLGYDIKIKKGEKAIKEMIDSDFCVNFDDVKAYTIENGELKSILDSEARLIGTNIIDSVSDEFSEVFDSLLSLED